MSQYTSNNPKQKEQAKSLRRLRMHISQTRWLTQAAHYIDSKIVFKQADMPDVELTASLISKTQRNLYQIRKSKKPASQILKNVEDWLGKRSTLLDKYKILNEVDIKKLQKEIQSGKAASKKEIARLLAYLEVEANCINIDEYQLSKLLLKSSDSSFALETFLFEYNHTEEAKALASLILGVLHRHERKNIIHLIKRKQQSEWLRQCYNWGMNYGFSEMPVASILLLKERGKKEIIKSLDSHHNSKLKIKLSEPTIKELLNNDFAPSAISQILKSVKQLNSSFEQLLDLQPVLPTGKTGNDRGLRKSLTSEHAALSTKFLSQAINWITESPNPNSPVEIADLINAVCSLDTSNNISNLKEIIYVIDTGMKLDRQLRSTWIELACKTTQIFWSTEEVRKKSYRKLKKRKATYNSNTIENSSKILAITKDAGTTISIMDLWLSSEVLNKEITDLETIGLILSWLKRLETTRKYSYADFITVVKQFPDLATLRNTLNPVIDLLEALDQENREHIFEVVFEYFVYFNATKHPIDDLLAELPEYIQAINDNKGGSCPCWCLTSGLFTITASGSKDKKQMAKELLHFFKMNTPVKYGFLEALKFSVKLAISAIDCLESGKFNRIYLKSKKLKLNPVDLFKSTISSFINLNDFDDTDFVNNGIKEIAKRPELLMLTLDKVSSHPKQVKDFVYNLGIVKRFDPTATARLKKLRRFTDIEDTARSTKTVVAKGWKSVLDKVPECKPLMLSYIIARSITKENAAPPPSILKVLELKQKLLQERSYLESFSGEEKQLASIKIRLKNLDIRINDQAQIDADIKQQLRKHLFHISRQAELAALAKVIQEAYKYQLKKITGEDPGNIEFDSYMRNAMLLTQDVSNNKRLLKKLIKSRVRKEKDFRFAIEANKMFLDYLREAKVPQEKWLGARPETFKAQNIPGRKVHLKLECDPLKILEMGNYFDTCLSMGDFNSFATVTNACDLNKRVLYAYDTRGNVIGRKLIALNLDGELVGFRTYTSVETKDGRSELRKLISDYIKEFAGECNLKMSNTGKVIPLSSKNWYDDGIVAWSSLPEKENNSKCSRSNPREREHSHS